MIEGLVVLAILLVMAGTLSAVVAVVAYRKGKRAGAREKEDLL